MYVCDGASALAFQHCIESHYVPFTLTSQSFPSILTQRYLNAMNLLCSEFQRLNCDVSIVITLNISLSAINSSNLSWTLKFEQTIPKEQNDNTLLNYGRWLFSSSFSLHPANLIVLTYVMKQPSNFIWYFLMKFRSFLWPIAIFCIKI